MAHVELDGKDVEKLYVFLHTHEKELGKGLISLKSRIERLLYEELSIEEMEKLEEETSCDS